jgi:8-amino-7-oxononanoate synthase
MSLLETFLSQQLQKRRNNKSLRVLRQDTYPIDLTSNDYLGLSRSIELTNRVTQKIDTLQLKNNGATGSRLLSGNSTYTETVEHKLADIFNSDAALIFNSGYCANVAVLSSIPQKGDTILYDELAHASIKDGARLSLANRHSFKHNDLEDLEGKLKISAGKKFIAIESIYSMDGDECRLSEIISLADKYEAFIILDEAHSTGVIGKNGNGLAALHSLEKKVTIRIYTFGKAMGCHGACVVGSAELIQYLINFARPFIYTTALPPHAIAAIDCSFDFLSENVGLQTVLKNKIELFLSLIKDTPFKTTSKSAIQAIVIPGVENVVKITTLLQHEGFDVRPILPPTVATAAERIRICLHTYNTEEELKKFSKSLIELSKTINL